MERDLRVSTELLLIESREKSQEMENAVVLSALDYLGSLAK